MNQSERQGWKRKWKNIVYVMGYYRKVKPSIFLHMVLTSAVGVVSSMLFVYFPSKIIDILSASQRPMQELGLAIGMIGVGLVLAEVVKTWSEQCFEVDLYSGLTKMHQQLNEVVMSCDYLLLEKKKMQDAFFEASDLILGGDKEGPKGVMKASKSVVLSLAGLLSFTVYLWQLHPGVVLALVLISAVASLVDAKTAQKEDAYRSASAGAKREVRYLDDKVASKAAGKEIRLYDCKRFYMRKYDGAVKRVLQNYQKSLQKGLQKDGLSSILLLIQNGIIISCLVWKIGRGELNVAAITWYIGIALEFSAYLDSFLEGIEALTKSSLEVSDIRRCLEQPSAQGAKAAERAARPVDGDIRFENVSFCYPDSDKRVLDKINLHIRAGEKIAVVGANGAGKTTFVKLLCGLYQPTEGEIYLGERPVGQMDDEERAAMMAPVFQDIMMLPMSIRENVSASERQGREEDEKVLACLKAAGCSGKLLDLEQLLVKDANSRAVDLSGGEKQKILLARALYKEAPILILDEPTAALDPLAEDALYRKYDALTENCTSIFISHRFASTKFCDRIFVFDKGHIVEEGSHEELLRQKGKYAEMFESQSVYYRKEGGEA